MKLIYPSAKGLARSFESIWNLVEEGVFKFDEKGIRFVGFESTRAALVDYSLDKENLLEYEIDKEIKIGLNIEYLKNIMKRARSNEMVKVETLESNVKISFETEKSKRTFTIPLLDTSNEPLGEPKIEYHDYVKINGEVLKEVIKDASIISDYVTFSITPDAFEVDVESERGKLQEVFEKGGEEVEELKVENGAKSSHLLQYLDYITKAAEKKEVVTLYLANDMPLKLEYNIEKAFVKYYLIAADRSV